jgi:hypothetical protein
MGVAASQTRLGTDEAQPWIAYVRMLLARERPSAPVPGYSGPGF